MSEVLLHNIESLVRFVDKFSYINHEIVVDRESDIFAYCNEAEQQGAYFLSRVKMNRLADESILFEVMVDENDKLQYEITLFDKNRKTINATIGVTAKRVLVHPPETAKK